MNQTTPAPTTDTDNLCCVAARQNGRAVLGDIIHRLRRRANQLETVSNMLPAVLTPEQDDALWSLACAAERL